MGTRKYLSTGGEGTGEDADDEFGLFADLPWQPAENEYGANPLKALREEAMDDLLLRLTEATRSQVSFLVDFIIAAAEGKYAEHDEKIAAIHADVREVLSWEDDQLRGYFNELAARLRGEFDDSDALLNAARDLRLDPEGS